MKRLFIGLAIGLGVSQVQAGPPSWHCIRQPIVLDTDGNLLVLPCVAAAPTTTKLDAEDEKLLDGLEIDRHNLSTLKGDPKTSELTDGIKMGFGQIVGHLCAKHPDIKLAPLTLKYESNTTLYGCNNIAEHP